MECYLENTQTMMKPGTGSVGGDKSLALPGRRG